jgi:hypothetical protein
MDKATLRRLKELEKACESSEAGPGFHIRVVFVSPSNVDANEEHELEQKRKEGSYERWCNGGAE